jgi:outer membrane immunogenic protein
MGASMIRTVSTATAMLALVVAPTLAADIPARMPVKAPAAVVAAYDWSGFYTATTIGGGWQDIDGVWVAPPDLHRTSATRFWTGSHVGYQVMMPNRWVIGVEGSYSAPWDKKYATSSTGPDCVNISGPAGSTCGARITNVWTIGGKVGHAFGNMMVYGAGGYANAKIEQFFSSNPSGVWDSSDSRRHGGWYVGAGFDVLVTRIMWSDLILGVEYRHYEFERGSHPTQMAGAARNFDATVDTIMAKATFKWVGAGPLGYLRR